MCCASGWRDRWYALDERRKLRVFSGHEELDPGPGWTVISLMNEKASGAREI